MRTAQSEREIEAAFWSRARIEANDVGYLTIAAAGDHACTLHWTRNDGALSAAAICCCSTPASNATRSTPPTSRARCRSPDASRRTARRSTISSGKRSAPASKASRPATISSSRTGARRACSPQGLIDLGILKTSLDEALDPENLSTGVTRCTASATCSGSTCTTARSARAEEYRYGKLREGMVLTVEPGLYFQPDDATVPERFRGIGVRIEDDVAVTATGAENLSAALPSKAGDVERWIAELWS